MRPLTWDEYYEKFDTWSESTRAQYVSRLSNVGDHSQVADIANRLYNQRASDKLIRMACDAGICFTAEDVYLIEFSVSPEVLQVAKDTINTWVVTHGWPDGSRKKRIKKLFGLAQQRQCSLIR